MLAPSDDTVADAFYIELPTGPVNQADLWVRLPSLQQSNEHCMGIVITPRCDLAHEKTKVVNYLPIFSIAEYMQRDGLAGLLEQVKKRSI